MWQWIVAIETVGLGVALVFLLRARLGAGAPCDAEDVREAIEASFQDDRRVPFDVCWTTQGLGRPAEPRVKICKSAHVLTVFDGERAVKSYRVAVGGGHGDKTREGDRCTPEGRFYVCTKNPQSRYVLSLGLSYPNVEDARRGLRDGLISRAEYDRIVQAIRRRTRPPWDTALGGEIMIHGDGAGRDWTLGCIAMDDDAIRELYPALPVGAPVVIVP